MDHHRHSAVSEESRRVDVQIRGDTWAHDVKSSNAWHRLVLTLDGGGIRGYAELLIIQELMIRIIAWELKLNKRVIDINEILPCHYFDYIFGTSTGGLVAIMLGRLRMSVPQALEVYRTVGDTIFGEKRMTNARGLNILTPKYRHQNVTEVVKDITRKYCKLHRPCDADDELLWPDQSDLGVDNAWDICQTVCISARTTDGKNSQAQPLRSYEYIHRQGYTHDPNGGIQDLDLLIWEAARATSAAPGYFKMFAKKDENGKLRRYKDGGTLLNNPAEKALNEVRDRDDNLSTETIRERVNPAVLLSIGTGIRHNTPFAELAEYSQRNREDKNLWRAVTDRFKEQVAVARHLVIRYTEGESIHRALRDTVVGNEHTWYRRLNVDVGLGTMHLGDWRKGIWHNPKTGRDELHPGGATLTDMEKAVHKYVTRTELNKANNIEWDLLPSEHIDQVAQRLVRHRTQRRNMVRTKAQRRKWHTHQGRWAFGSAMEPWDDLSCDKPYEYNPENRKDLSNATSAASRSAADLRD